MVKEGEKKRAWTLAQKAEIICKHLNGHITVRALEKKYHADRGLICQWGKNDIAEGERSFPHKGHPEKPPMTLHVSQNLSWAERLRLMAAKLEIEDERLKG